MPLCYPARSAQVVPLRVAPVAAEPFGGIPRGSVVKHEMPAEEFRLAPGSPATPMRGKIRGCDPWCRLIPAQIFIFPAFWAFSPSPRRSSRDMARNAIHWFIGPGNFFLEPFGRSWSFAYETKAKPGTLLWRWLMHVSRISIQAKRIGLSKVSPRHSPDLSYGVTYMNHIPMLPFVKLPVVALAACVAMTALSGPRQGLVADSAAQAKPLMVGATAPDATLQALNGKDVSLSAILKRRRTVLIFYRGGWCPYCNAHLSDLATIEKQVTAHGFQIIAISPDTPTELNKTFTKDHLNYKLFSDSSAEAMKKFGVAYRLDDPTFTKMRDSYGVDIEVSSGQTRITSCQCHRCSWSTRRQDCLRPCEPRLQSASQGVGNLERDRFYVAQAASPNVRQTRQTLTSG